MFSSNLLPLLHLSDPALPIGGFSHSAGLETYVQSGIVNDKETAKNFVTQQLSQNIRYTDAALVSLVINAACDSDIETIVRLDELCSAVKLPKEMRQASNKLGLRLLRIYQYKDAFVTLHKYTQLIRANKTPGHYSVVFGLLAQALGIKKEEALTGFYYNAATGFVTNSVKLIPLGQQDGQEIIMSLFPLIEQLVQMSLTPDESMIGYCCNSFDIRSMQHEQLYTRLYMS